MSTLNFEHCRQWLIELDYRPLFVTVSGAHLYGFPSPDSDVDLRGCHQFPLRQAVRLDPPDETLEKETLLAGGEVELVSHEIRKYLELLVKNNGYVLEQIFSPLVVLGQPLLDELRPVARACITRHHYHHYRGFFATQRKLLAKESPWRVKPLLYAYRVLLTGIHLLRTGEVEANLLRLNATFRLPFISDLVALKQTEQAAAAGLDVAFHDEQLQQLSAVLDRSFEESRLPETRDRERVNQFLVQLRCPA